MDVLTRSEKMQKFKSYISDSVSMLNAKTHDCTFRKMLKKYDLFRRVSRRKSLLYKNNMAALLKFAELSWNNVL